MLATGYAVSIYGGELMRNIDATEAAAPMPMVMVPASSSLTYNSEDMEPLLLALHIPCRNDVFPDCDHT